MKRYIKSSIAQSNNINDADLWEVIDDEEFEFSGIQDVGYDDDGNIMVIFNHAISEDMIEPTAEELLIAFRQYGYPVHEWNTNGNNIFILSRGGILGSTAANLEYGDDIQEIDQEFTSENTSINSGKLPAIFKMIHLEPGTINIDYGGGRFDNVAEYLTQYDVINLVYDPYNRSKEHNQEVIRTVKAAGGADTATCSNVLNVIKEPEVRQNVLQNIRKLVKPNGSIYITVYEGSGKGNEGPTKSGYQLNRRTADYLEEIQQVFPDAVRKGKLIVATNSGSVNSSTKFNRISSASEAQSAIAAEVHQQVANKIKEVMTNDWHWEADEVNDYSRVAVTFTEDNQLMIEVGIEAGYDSLMKMCKALDPIVQSFDKDSYFEPVDPGIIAAWLSISEFDKIATASEVTIQGGWYDPPEDDSWEELDSDDEVIELTLDATVHIDENGSWEYDDTNYPWAASPDNKRGDWYTYEYNVYIGDKTSIVEYVDELLEPMMPVKEGEYHIKGDVTLVFSVEGIEVKRDYFWDERHGEDYDEVAYTDDAETSFLYDKSYIENFEITER